MPTTWVRCCLITLHQRTTSRSLHAQDVTGRRHDFIISEKIRFCFILLYCHTLNNQPKNDTTWCPPRLWTNLLLFFQCIMSPSGCCLKEGKKDSRSSRFLPDEYRTPAIGGDWLWCSSRHNNNNNMPPPPLTTIDLHPPPTTDDISYMVLDGV